MSESALTVVLSDEQAEAIARRTADLVLAELRPAAPASQRQTSESPSLSPAEVALRLGVSRKTVYVAIGAGELGASKVRGRWRVTVAAVDAWVAAGRAIPPAPETPRPAGISAAPGGRLRRKLVGGGIADARPLPAAQSANGVRTEGPR